MASVPNPKDKLKIISSTNGVSRLIAFTDGVVAIAITIIVLPLVDAARATTNVSTSNFLHENGLSFFAAALSFLVIANFWKDHHRIYRQEAPSSRALINANLLWLASIVFLPLPTVLLVNSPGNDRIAHGLYVFTVLIATVAIRLQELLIKRSKNSSTKAVYLTRETVADWSVVYFTLLSFILTISIPGIGVYPMLLILLAAPLRHLILRFDKTR